jgi:hypothetical protein
MEENLPQHPDQVIRQFHSNHEGPPSNPSPERIRDTPATMMQGVKRQKRVCYGKGKKARGVSYPPARVRARRGIFFLGETAKEAGRVG